MSAMSPLFLAGCTSFGTEDIKPIADEIIKCTDVAATCPIGYVCFPADDPVTTMVETGKCCTIATVDDLTTPNVDEHTTKCVELKGNSAGKGNGKNKKNILGIFGF